MKDILKQNYCTNTEDKFMVQTRSQNKARGTKLPAVHGTKKTLVPHEIPEKQQVSTIKSRQEKIAIKRKVKLPPNETLGPVEPKESNFDTQDIMTMPRQEIDQIPPDIHPINRPPPRPPDLDDVNDRKNITPELIMDPNIDFKENSPHQECIISETYESPDQSYIREPHKLADLVDTSKIVQKYLSKQIDIDKILDIITRKVLKGTHLPLTVKEIQAGYLTSPYFKDLYRYLAQNKLPSKRSAICKKEILAESFILLDSLLYKLVTTPDKGTALLAIPEICADKIITLYHTILFAGHQGSVKTYLTIRDKLFIPGLMHYLRSFLKGCHICQLIRNDKPPMRQLQTRINLNYRP